DFCSNVANKSIAELHVTLVQHGCSLVAGTKNEIFSSNLNLKVSEIDGVLTKLCVAFSRDKVTENEPKYVQDSLTLHKNDIVKLLLEDKAVFFVCGDARNMAKDVRNCLINLIAIETNCDEDAAREKFSVVLAEKRYKEDIWT
uniref:Oxidoreductase FAD/NAD(P)-binding domain-containing protein n=1 Tax=Ciona savignyi TaxID=51511 RepID=H2YB51_CIOSA